jgi:salicylate hydroxylase
LGRRGIPSILFEQAEHLEETGAGIQLSPNATRILLAFGLGDALRAKIVTPQAVRVMSSKGRELVRVPLGTTSEQRYGAPYWLLHRADLQAALVAAAAEIPTITLRLGERVEDYVVKENGVVLHSHRGAVALETYGRALVGADGLWSTIRSRIEPEPARFARRSAWRALIPVDSVAAEFRSPLVHLWLGRDAHLVHYPVNAGAMINIVAIVHDEGEREGWSAVGAREKLLARFPGSEWDSSARTLVALPKQWQKWSLYHRPPLRRTGDEPVTLLGDAAHPVLPFLAQGAALAIEDAWVLADALSASPAQTAHALRAYEANRYARARRVQRAARSNGSTYHLAGFPAFARDRVMQMLGGQGMLKRYDWLYGYRPILSERDDTFPG